MISFLVAERRWEDSFKKAVPSADNVPIKSYDGNLASTTRKASVFHRTTSLIDLYKDFRVFVAGKL